MKALRRSNREQCEITHAPPLRVRRYRSSDLQNVIDLIRDSLGPGPTGERSRDFFEWKHLENPFGRSLLLVAEIDDAIVGFRAFMRWRFSYLESTVHAVRAVDTATRPGYRGRGVFTQLTTQAVDEARDIAQMIFNTPNNKSLPGYLKMGWTIVEKPRVLIRTLRPVHLVSSILSSAEAIRQQEDLRVNAMPVDELLSKESQVRDLLEEASIHAPELRTARTLDYLRWRYQAIPGLRYWALSREVAGDIRGMAIFRVQMRRGLRESTLADLVARPGDCRTIRTLLRELTKAAAVDHVAIRLHDHSSIRSAHRLGFLGVPSGVKLVARNLASNLEPTVSPIRSWALTIGDLEVF